MEPVPTECLAGARPYGTKALQRNSRSQTGIRNSESVDQRDRILAELGTERGD